jgi:hypothetical protein
MVNNNTYVKSIAYLLLVVVAGAALSCASSYNPDIERGSTYKFKRGYPDLRFTAVGFVDEQNESFLNLAAEVVYGSLMYKRKGNKRKADLSIEYRILDQGNNDEVVQSRRFSFDQVIDVSLTKSQKRVFKFNRDVPVAPGNYEVQFTIIDQTTNRRIT